MWTVFVEYTVLDEKMEAYHRIVPEIREITAAMGGVIRHRILKAVDQPGKFVEVIHVSSEEDARRVLSARTSGTHPRTEELFKNGCRGWLFASMDETRE
ncbi:antibiotic biosynthesis monooxygenase [Staphylospora marina]|uniref:antibiotic biosynthesis monooxygenase n=1 Tax=Staphylospora marina TaxID=2490858 RepID=UPI0013DDBFF0|nr:antibiotic biosynthesis monooxygenase [Staphylospora marina]